MNDDDKEKRCQLIVDLLADKGLRKGEGAQRLAHAMVNGIRDNTGLKKTDFVYKKPNPGWSEQAYANGLRYMAKEHGGDSLLERMADSWDQAAEEKRKMPAWKRIIFNFLERIM